MERKGREILDEVTRENRVAIVMLGRPYHNDPGMNHSVLEEFQALGYPILSMRSLPRDKERMDALFAEDIAKGVIVNGLDITDVWPENYSTNSVQKVWVKTYAYTLMLLKEKLEDQGIKKVELDRALVEKKLELMAGLQQKLAMVGRIDEKLDREIQTLATQVAVWREADEASKPKVKRTAALNVMRT